MTDISAKAVMALRQSSGAPMMACKKALIDSLGDIEKATVLLRKQGMAASAKKAGRPTADGLIAQALSTDQRRGVLIEINSETDFVARNQLFQKFVSQVAALALKANPAERDLKTLADQPLEGNDTVGESLQNLIATIGENLTLNRMQIVESKSGCVGGYIHGAIAPNCGRQGALIALEGAAEPELARKIAMHVTAAKPKFVSVDKVDEAVLKTEREIALDQARASGKPEPVLAKIVGGRINKFLSETVLTEQKFIMDENQLVKEYVASINPQATVSEMTLFVLGTG